MRRRWLLVANRLGLDAAVWADLVRRYGEPGRFYHTLRHIRRCLWHLDRVRPWCRDPDLVELVLWFHDAVYVPGRADNEERSAALLQEVAARAGLDAGWAAEAALLVMATAHAVPPATGGGSASADGGDAVADGDAALVRDIDLAILGEPRSRYAAYERRVRREYAFLGDAEWREGRSRVLRVFFDRPRLYETLHFRETYEARARRNLESSLAGLERARTVRMHSD